MFVMRAITTSFFYWFGVLSFSGIVCLCALAWWRLRREERQRVRNRRCVHCGRWTKGHQDECAFCYRSYVTGLTHPSAIANERNVIHVLRGGIEGAALQTDPTGQVLSIRTTSGVDVRVRIGRIAMSMIPLLFFMACGSSPTSPTPPPVPMPGPMPPTPITITGHVSATNGGQPLAGVSAALGATTTTTDGSGSFSASMAPQMSIALMLTGTSIVPRTLHVAAMNTRDVQADAIAMGNGFDLGFYRQLVRNSLETVNLNPLRRLTAAPRVYLQTSVDDRSLQMVESVIRESLPQWTGFQVAGVERGTNTREGQSGWITVKWDARGTQQCGNSTVGVDGGFMLLSSDCSCNGLKGFPALVRHELGHAVGFWHTDARSDVMNATDAVCDKPISARERYHAAIAYSRPVGNQDPDTDPTGVVNLTPLRAIP